MLSSLSKKNFRRYLLRNMLMLLSPYGAFDLVNFFFFLEILYLAFRTVLFWWPSTFPGCCFSVSFAGSFSSSSLHWAQASDPFFCLFTFISWMISPGLMALHDICIGMTTKFISLVYTAPLHSKLKYLTSCLNA